MARGRDPIIVALDMDDRRRMLHLADILRGEVETVKVGLEAYTCLGPEVLDELRSRGFRVFADLKLHDIPNTVRGAVRGLVRRGVDMLTVHASGGGEMLRAAVGAAREEAEVSGSAPPAVLGVTVLTSLDDASAREVGWTSKVGEVVLSLARLGLSCGLDGVVASAREVGILRGELSPEALIVTPGIRLPGSATHDQARTATPAEALSAGADFLVVGRAVIVDPDPRSALRAVRRAAGLE